MTAQEGSPDTEAAAETGYCGRCEDDTPWAECPGRCGDMVCSVCLHCGNCRADLHDDVERAAPGP